MDYMALLDQHEKRLKELTARRSEIQAQIEALSNEDAGLEREALGLEEAISIYRFLTQQTEEGTLSLDPETTGFTDAVRMVIQDAYPAPLLPTEIRDELIKHG